MTPSPSRNRLAPFPLFLACALAACGQSDLGEPGTDETFVDDPAEVTDIVDEDAAGQGFTDELGTTEQELSRPLMRMPFRCGQVWRAQTRSNHSPQLAVDFNREGDFGDAVLASAAGTVTRSETEGNTSYGHWIEIAHADGYRTRYAHLSVRGVRVGQRVRQGEKIGEVGNSGGSSGAHLHYEQLLNGSPIRVRLGKTAVRYFETRSYRSRNGC